MCIILFEYLFIRLIMNCLTELYEKYFNKPKVYSLITTACEEIENDLRNNPDLRFKKTQLLKIKELELPIKTLFSLFNYNILYLILSFHVKISQDQIQRASYISDVIKQSVNDEIIEVNQFLHYKKVENIESLESIINDKQEILNKIVSIELSMERVDRASPGIYDVITIILLLLLIIVNRI